MTEKGSSRRRNQRRGDNAWGKKKATKSGEGREGEKEKRERKQDKKTQYKPME